MGKMLSHLAVLLVGAGAMLAAVVANGQTLRITAPVAKPMPLTRREHAASRAPVPLAASERTARYRQASGDQTGDASGRPVRYQMTSFPPDGFVELVAADLVTTTYDDVDMQADGAVMFAADRSLVPSNDVLFLDCAIDVSNGGHVRWVGEARGGGHVSVGDTLMIAGHRAVFAIDMRQVKSSMVTLVGDQRWTFHYCDVTTVK